MTDKPGQYDHSAVEAGEAVLLAELAALPKAIRPGRDPWPQISHRISAASSGGVTASGPGRGINGGIGWALAASVVLVAVSGLFIMQTPRIQNPELQPAAVLQSGQPVAQEAAIPLPTSSAELEYRAAFREFARLDLSQSAVSAHAKDAMLQDWALMRQLEQDILLALQQDPDNSLLQDRWMHLRASQLQLLHVIAEAGQLPGRTLI